MQFKELKVLAREMIKGRHMIRYLAVGDTPPFRCFRLASQSRRWPIISPA